MSAKKCLKCNKDTTNSLYACSDCLDEINSVRRSADLNRFMKKGFLMRVYKIIFATGMIQVLIALFFGLSVLSRFPDLPPFITAYLFYPGILGFIIYFLFGVVFERYNSRLMLHLYSDPRYYCQTRVERLRDRRLYKIIISLFLGVIFVLFFFITFFSLIDFFFYHFKLSMTLEMFRQKLVNLLVWPGLILGLSVSSFVYDDWIKKLEK